MGVHLRMTLSVYAAGVLLALSLFMAPVRSVKWKSSGTHLLVQQDTSADLNPAEENLRHRRDVDDEGDLVEVRQFHVSSMLYSRFATVTIESEVVNIAEEGSHEVGFQVQVPETAFMSNFTMVVDGQLYVAQVMEKEAAEKRYEEARERNQTAGQVKQDPVKAERGMELFTINVNLAPGAIAYFTLVYNELLERRRGVYRQRLVVQPGTIVSDLSVRAAFAERQGFSYFAYTVPGNDVELTSGSDTDKTTMTASPTKRELVFEPTVEMQRSFDAERGIHGEFTIFYSVNNDPAGGRIIVQNEYFAHFFAPPGLDPLPKNILFIIDISGSMSGDKILKAKEAMLNILDDLKTRTADMFNILLFDDRQEKWEPSPVTTLGSELERAKRFLEINLKSRGGTNIYGALMTGLDMLLYGQEGRRCDKADIIVFLTDGDPTSGETNIDTIIDDVTNRNENRASIFSLGFGMNLNFGFLSKLSMRNQGSARRIFAESDAQVQLRDFYEEISKPVLCDVVARYRTDVVEADLLTLTVFPLFFDGKEIVVAGKTKVGASRLDATSMGAELHGMGSEGAMDFVVAAGKVEVMTDTDDALTEKLWAYMKIKNLLNDLDKLDSEAERNATRSLALNMSLTYGFVTPLTSFSIVVEDDRGSDMEQEDMMAAGFPVGGNKRVSYSDTGSAAGQASVLGWSWAFLGLLIAGLLVHF